MTLTTAVPTTHPLPCSELDPVTSCELQRIASDTAPLRLALVQMRCEKADIAGNLRRIVDETSAAAARGIDVVCFPEMSLTGYIDPTRQPDGVIDVDGPEVAALREATGALSCLIVAGLVERNPAGKPFITQIALRGGELLVVYRKRTVIDEESEWFTPGAPSSPVVEHAGWQIGLAICADIECADIFRDSAEAGARIIVECAAPGLDGAQATRNWQAGFDWWRDECHTKLGGYAKELGVYIAVATQAGRTMDEDFPGGGYLFGPDGTCLAETPDWRDGVLDVEVAADMEDTHG